MKIIELKKVAHNVKIGQPCKYHEPTITEDCILVSEGQPIGFYLREMPEKLCKLSDVANQEFRSKNVPKQRMSRAVSSEMLAKKIENNLAQYCTIIGSVPPKPQFRRKYPSQSAVHAKPSAKTFIKAMYLMAKESEELIKEFLPVQYAKQKQLLSHVPEHLRFTDMFTSSISNYNISAPMHQDRANIKETVNVIITKRHGTNGGCLYVPDYNATFEQANNSILVYPAWRNMHGVTPIQETHKDGYRNTLIFYALRAFLNEE